MSRVKCVSPAGWDYGEPVVVPLKWSSRGLIGSDRREFMKRAGDAGDLFLQQLRNVKIAKDEVPVHGIGLAAYERWGQNRNGDRFKRAVCEERHGTFVKFGRVYRSHINQDPAKSYGVIKASAYNPIMHRVELLACLNAEKSAADRNGGFIADKEIEKLAQDNDLPASMACTIDHDVCSWCHNKAPTPAQYCTAKTCAAGGCRDNLGKIMKIAGDIHHLGVDNPSPLTWFDWSHVFRPACRTAYGHAGDHLFKAASEIACEHAIGGFKMAEELGLMVPSHIQLEHDLYAARQRDSRVADCIKLAHGIVALEKRAEKDSPARLAFSPSFQGSLPAEMPAIASKRASFLAALADAKTTLPLREFARLTKRAELTPRATGRLGGVLERLLSQGLLETAVVKSAYDPGDEPASFADRAMALRVKAAWGLDAESVRDRTAEATIRGFASPEIVFEKTAGDDAEADALAEDYAVYKLAALRRIAANGDPDFLLTVTNSVHQNTVS